MDREEGGARREVDREGGIGRGREGWIGRKRCKELEGGGQGGRWTGREG